MSTTALDPVPPAPAAPDHRTPRWVSAMIAVGIVMSMLVAPLVFSTGSNEAQAGHRPSASCRYPVAGWLVLSRPCEDAKDLPKEIKQCLFALFGAWLVAETFAAPLAPAAAGALVGCGGSLIK